MSGDEAGKFPGRDPLPAGTDHGMNFMVVDDAPTGGGRRPEEQPADRRRRAGHEQPAQARSSLEEPVDQRRMPRQGECQREHGRMQRGESPLVGKGDEEGRQAGGRDRSK